MKDLNVCLASQNKHKHRELSEIFQSFGFNSPKLPLYTIEVEEYGKTFEENAMIKAKAYGEALHSKTLADDSGLIIDALHNELGIHSARYKIQLNQEEKNLDIIERLKNIPMDKRTARFVSVLALFFPDTNNILIAKGVMEGYIATRISGTGGFGYDPIFIPKGYNTTVATLSQAEKNRISHRYHSVKNLLNFKLLA